MSEQKTIPFDLEKFKAGMKALTRDGRVATFVGICDSCAYTNQLIASLEGETCTRSFSLDGAYFKESMVACFDIASMVSRHQALIDAYDPENTYLCARDEGDLWAIVQGEPLWDESILYRLHKHNDLIKAWKKGAKIEQFSPFHGWSEKEVPEWLEMAYYRIKPEPVIHCLAYNPKRFNHEQTTAVAQEWLEKKLQKLTAGTLFRSGKYDRTRTNQATKRS